MPIGTAFHERTFPLCQSLNYREWSGYYTVSVYEVHHEHEYNAIRNASALIDISPLYKYLISGKDATKLVNRVITRDMNKVAVGQVIYCCWCDEQGKVIDDGTVTRLEENKYRWTAADPSLRWFKQSAISMDVQIEDISEKMAALALQGPTSGKLLKSVAEADMANLKYFRMTSGKIRACPWTSRAPVTPAILATKFGFRGTMRSKSGTRSRKPANSLICTRRECWRSMSRASKLACS